MRSLGQQQHEMPASLSIPVLPYDTPFRDLGSCNTVAHIHRNIHRYFWGKVATLPWPILYSFLSMSPVYRRGVLHEKISLFFTSTLYCLPGCRPGGTISMQCPNTGNDSAWNARL